MMSRDSVRYAVVTVSLAAALAGCGQKPEALVASAKDYLAKHEASAAVIQLRNALQQDPDLAEARFLLGKALLQTGDAAGAEKELREAATLQYPQEELAPLWARSLVLTGQYRKVVDELAKVDVASPLGKAELSTAVGDAHLALRNFNRARTAFDEALSAEPRHVPALLGQARLAAAAGDLKAAAATLERALAISPSDAESLELKAGILVERKEVPQALAVYRKALEARPDLVRVHAAIISILMDEKQLDEAAKQLAAMKRVAPNHPETQYLHAWIAYRQKDLPAARAAIQQHLRASSENVRGLLLGGMIEYELQAYAQAEKYLSQVLQRTPRQATAWRLLMESYVRSGQASRALDRVQPMLDQVPNDPSLLALAGEVFMLNGEAKQAATYFAKAAALDPQDARSRTGLALSQLAQGKTDPAFRELEQAASVGTDARADFALVAAHVQRREFDKALAVVSRWEQKQPKSAVPHNVRGGVLLAKGDRAGARKEFERAIAIDPAYFPAAAQLARLDLADNKPDAARKRFDSLLAKEPDSLPALLGLAEVRARTGGSAQDVTALLRKAISAHPTDSAPRLALIQYYVNTKDFKAAMSAAQEAMAAMPNRVEILDVAGAAHQAGGETNQALSIYRKLLALEPKSPMPLMRIAQLQFATNNKAEAMENLQKALAMKPDLVDAQRTLIASHVSLGELKEAMSVAHDVQKQRPKEPVGYIFEGDIHRARQSWTDAANAYRAALKHARSTDVAIRLHSVLTQTKGSEAERFANEWLKENSSDRAFRLYLAQAAGANGDFPGAAQHYRQLLERDPQNVVALNNLAWLEGRLKDPKAIEHAEQANRLAPNQPAIMDTLGVLHVQLGDAKRGVQLLQNAVALDPQSAAIRLNFAKALMVTGHKAEARKQLEELEKLGEKFPGQSEVARLKQAL